MGAIDFGKEHPVITGGLIALGTITGIALGGAAKIPGLVDVCKGMGICGDVKTITTEKPVDKWHNDTKWLNNSFPDLFNQTFNITNDVFTFDELKAMHGNDTFENKSWCYDVLAKDPFVDWYASAKSLDKAQKKSLYDKPFSELIKLAEDMGLNEGLAVLYKGVRNEVAQATSDLNDSVVKQLDGKPLLDAILLGEKILAVDPSIDQAYGDALKSTYLGHEGLAKADAYFNQDKFSSLENKADEYKWRTLETKKIQASVLSNTSGSARAEALDTLVAYHTDYNWSAEVNAFYVGPMDNNFKNAIKTNANLSKDAKDAILNFADLSGQNVSYVLVVDTPGKDAYVQAIKDDKKTYFLENNYRTGAVIKDSDVAELQKYKL